MPRPRMSFMGVIGFLALLASACGLAGSDRNPNAKSQGTTEAKPESITADDFDPAQFDHSTNIDNKWFPLKPGMQFVFEGFATDDDDGRVTRRVVFTVTDLTKVINGVRTAVNWDRDYTEGELEEQELAFFAQDNHGNVWHLGEYPEEYDDGKFTKAPAWLAGLEGATAGIAMRAEPQLGTPSYAQGYAPPPLNWIDRGRVYQTLQNTCVQVDCFEDVLVIEEFERNKPGSSQLKYYAPGVGNVRVGWRGPKEVEKETLELVKLVHLSPKALARVRASALQLEKHAYQIKDFYRQTRPAKVLRRS